MLEDFSREEILRYSRHLMIPEVGLEGQNKIKHASVLLIGAGGLGSPVGLYLAAAGVGHIGIVDYDRVEISNLQRQVLHGMSTLGMPKAESARKRMLDLNPSIQVDVFQSAFTSENAFEVSRNYDILVDGTDNLPTRYLINDLCVLTSRPFVFGAVYRFEGQVCLFDAQKGPCYRCVFKEPPPPELVPSCADNGVFGIMPGLIGILQATETLKSILGIGESLAGKLMIVGVLNSSFQTIQIQKDAECKICGTHPQITTLIDYDEYCGVPYTNRPVHQQKLREISPQQLVERIASAEPLRLIDVRHPVEAQISSLPGAESIPYEVLSQNLEHLKPEDEIVLFCRTGNRSMWAQRLLIEAGFKNVWNLKGGINAWAEEIDPSVWQY